MTQGMAFVARPSSLVLTALTVLTTSTLSAQSWKSKIDALIAQPPFDNSFWGVALVDDKGKLVYDHNARTMFVPASNTKIVVTAVASALLPPDFTVKTSVYATGPVIDGVLRGDLVLYGRGDPAVGVRCYAVDTTTAGACDRDPAWQVRKLVTQLQQRGIKTIDGRIVGDGSYFEPTMIHPFWNLFDTFWWYAAPVTGLAMNDNSVDVHWEPGPSVGAPALITVSPPYTELRFENRTTTAPAGGETDVPDRMWRTFGTMDAWAEGSVALDSRGGTDYFAVPDPNLFAANALKSVLQQNGIGVTGSTTSTTDSTTYALVRKTVPLAEVESRPLKDWVFPILNTSQNFYAEMLLKQVGKQFGASGSWEEGLKVERRFLIDSVGVDSTTFSVSDGSGLASNNLVSPLAFTQILRFIRKHPHAQTFLTGLPQSGKKGSLLRRFQGTPLADKVQAKTGSISRVNTLSGFIDMGDGKIWTFSVEVNNQAVGGGATIRKIDQVVVAMAAAAGMR
jgi:D-alanyl-D-alanine carboxypeptidase/D-alanyl-D-alanine-endopeptidase (penicillin-binding protein 4)